MIGSLTPDYFAKVYQESDDPWSFASSAYEAAKYDETLKALPAVRFASALEVGCSIGVFTDRLAERCECLLALDISERALDLARERCRERTNITFARMDVSKDFPAGPFDLTVLSEVAYYWSAEDLTTAAKAIRAHMAPDGHLLLVHWTAPVQGYPATGDYVHDYFLTLPALAHRLHRRTGEYRLDLFQGR